ncbi:hypothetical protein E2C01_003717 [Portunus trituberculatus]|uniref:Uncharacterized protein n=1 Tax=Portunus trituberculatus TaxID=210409 RepID=A0A5B7CQX7_PORTR|nr:hypothetical protein [Portunus trituberculatus]
MRKDGKKARSARAGERQRQTSGQPQCTQRGCQRILLMLGRGGGQRQGVDQPGTTLLAKCSTIAAKIQR